MAHAALANIAAHLSSKGLPSDDESCLGFAAEIAVSVHRRTGNIRANKLAAQLAGDLLYFGLTIEQRAEIYADNRDWLKSMSR